MMSVYSETHINEIIEQWLDLAELTSTEHQRTLLYTLVKKMCTITATESDHLVIQRLWSATVNSQDYDKQAWNSIQNQLSGVGIHV
jgi:hypothetical protein